MQFFAPGADNNVSHRNTELEAHQPSFFSLSKKGLSPREGKGLVPGGTASKGAEPDLYPRVPDPKPVPDQGPPLPYLHLHKAPGLWLGLPTLWTWRLL